MTVEGRFDGTAATGTVAGRVRSRRAGGRVRHCSTRGAWRMRIPAVSATPAAPQPSAVYRGLTSQQGDVPRPFLLGVTRRGRIETTVFEYKMGCARLADENNNISPGARIRSDGTFRIRERFRLGSGRIVERVRLRIDGGFVAGGVAGALRVRGVVRNRRTGRVIDRCDTGRLTFGASL